MKRPIFFPLLAGGLVSATALAADLSPAVAQWLAAQPGVRTWSADFTQTRRLKTLTQPLVATGHVWFAEPNRFRWELGQPPKTIAVRAPEEMQVFYPLLKRVERYPLTGKGTGPWRDAMALLEAGFPRSQTEIESRFRILSQTLTNGICELVLQPKSSAARKMMPQIGISFDTNGFSLRATQLEFADGSTMRNDFSNAALNPALDERMFAPPVPPDYKVVEPLKK